MHSSISSSIHPPLEPGFISPALWNRFYRRLVKADPQPQQITFALIRHNHSVSIHHETILGQGHSSSHLTERYLERVFKFLLWQKGASRVLIAGSDAVTASLAAAYSKGGPRSFDFTLMGEKLHGQTFEILSCPADSLPGEHQPTYNLGGHQGGCRIGLDLGGSFRKVVALCENKVVYSNATPWSPYFQTDPQFHLTEIKDSLTRAAAHLPSVSAIGCSAAGSYLDNRVLAASLFRGISQSTFAKVIRPMFLNLREEWGGIPFEVINDGEVTALAGAQQLGKTEVLGLSLGTSLAGGYVTPSGALTPWLNELAFVPVDYNPDGSIDEWSGDIGCGVQYFSQHAIVRWAQHAGFRWPEIQSVSERAFAVQQAMHAGDERARRVFETLGICLGYAIAHFSDFYEFRHILVLGGVISGMSAEIVLFSANKVLRSEFPALADTIQIHTSHESGNRFHQAITAAGLADCSRLGRDH